MRELRDHVVPSDPASQLQVFAVDEPGAGGACHEYRIIAFDGEDRPIRTVDLRISFQNGPIKENGINGVTQEALLAIVIDRLRSFQAGPFPCSENHMALRNCETALDWLQQRTLKRIERGVEGKTVA